MNKVMRHLKNYFIPHSGNDHKPHSLRHKTMMLLFMVVIIAELGFLVQVFVVFDKTKFLATVLPAVLTSLTNEDRSKNDVPPLVENELLKRAAEEKANDMATKGYFAHTSPEGITPWYWLDQVGYKYLHAGENLAVNFFESDDVEQAWMNSPTHRANIVKKDYTEIGIGVARGKYQGRNTIFVAQFFGKPVPVIASELITPEVPPTNVVNAETPKLASTPAPKPTPTPVRNPSPTPTPATQPPLVATNTPPAPNTSVPTSIEVLGEETTEASIPITETSFISKIKEFFQNALTSPREVVNSIYFTISMFVLLAICLAVFVRSELKHPIILARGFALIAVIFVLSFINIKVFTTRTEVPMANISANVIQVLP